MGHYILLMTLTPEGREHMLNNPAAVVDATNEVNVSGVVSLGLYAVLGDYDFVHIIEAPDNDAIARYALELGVRAGVHTATMPAVPVAHLQDQYDGDPHAETGAEVDPSMWPRGEERR
ncbi:MAG: GYD domain-containing protein [Dehalococcoidia bacterium]